MKNNRMKVAIIGTGNIGTDILIKLKRSDILECSLFAGIHKDSKGMKLAERMGVQTTDKSIRAIEENPDCCEVVFDATSAEIHKKNAPILRRLGKYTIDLTPSKIGKMCVPILNMEECLKVDNSNFAH